MMVSLITYRGFPKCGVETVADLKILHDVFYKRYKVICVIDGDKWITTKSGSHILIGENGEVKAGMGGKFNGQPLESTASGGEGETQNTAANSEKSSTISPSGANEFKHKGFKNKQYRNNHLSKHKKEYPYLTPEQYEKKAMELIQKPVGDGILGHITKDGIIVRYDTATNDFAKGHPDRGVYTMNKPAPGKKYYDGQREEDLSRGGSE